MPEDLPDRMPEDMSDRMPEDLPVRKCKNVTVGITRSKVFFSPGLIALATWHRQAKTHGPSSNHSYPGSGPTQVG